MMNVKKVGLPNLKAKGIKIGQEHKASVTTSTLDTGLIVESFTESWLNKIAIPEIKIISEYPFPPRKYVIRIEVPRIKVMKLELLERLIFNKPRNTPRVSAIINISINFQNKFESERLDSSRSNLNEVLIPKWLGGVGYDKKVSDLEK